MMNQSNDNIFRNLLVIINLNIVCDFISLKQAYDRRAKETKKFPELEKMGTIYIRKTVGDSSRRLQPKWYSLGIRNRSIS